MKLQKEQNIAIYYFMKDLYKNLILLNIILTYN